MITDYELAVLIIRACSSRNLFIKHHICPTIKVSVDQQLFGYPDSPKYIILCSAQEINEYGFGTT